MTENVNIFTRRKKLTINNNSGGALTDYQVRVTVTYASAMQAAFGDIRFADASGAMFSYWIESKTDSSTAVVWIKVNLPNSGAGAAGDNTVYMYYGNPAVASLSDGANTFIDFSDFTDFTNWTQQAGTWTITGGVLTAPASGAVHLRRDITISSSSYKIETKIKGSGLYYTGMLFVEADNPAVLTAAINVFFDELNHNVEGSPDWNWFTQSPTFVTTDNVYYILGVAVNPGNNKAYAYTTDRASFIQTNAFGDGSGIGNYWGFYRDTYSNQFSVDWVFVRQYVATEPTVTTGQEEYPRVGRMLIF